LASIAFRAGSEELAKRLNELETRMERKLMTQDQAIVGILDAIRQLMTPPPAQKKRSIEFVTVEK
jgi:ATP-dependent Clp protease ATP-binding subunit ClpA